MHTHLDMTQRFEADVQAKYCEQSVPSLQDLAKDAYQAGIRGILHCACDFPSILEISAVLNELELRPEELGEAGESAGESSFGTDLSGGLNGDLSKNPAFVAGAIALHPNESVLHCAGKGGRAELLLPAPDGLEPPKLEEHHMNYSVEEAVEKIEQLIKADPRIKVIGETGLDYFRTHETGREVQQSSLRQHIELAKSLALPVQIHDREAHADVVKILKDLRPERVLFHSFSGDTELARECIAQGWYMSFSGPLTYKPNDSLRRAFRHAFEQAPELLLTETDAPFLTPVPHRGRTNSPAQIPHTIRFMAELLETDLTKLCEQFAQNAADVL